MSDFDIHENGQLRITAAGEQTTLLPIPDEKIAPSSGPDLRSEGAGMAAIRTLVSDYLHFADQAKQCRKGSLEQHAICGYAARVRMALRSQYGVTEADLERFIEDAKRV